MGTCRGVLASREFKGPDSLPWQKFRIRPLNLPRQRRLIENSFLERDEIDRVQAYLATEGGNIGANPLFVSLLCRYVKDNRGAIPTDHDLLSSHIARLAAREPDYLLKKYGLAPDELLAGAESIAVAMALQPDLSLAPRQEQLLQLIEPGSDSERFRRLLMALVDVKIGRFDMPSTRSGELRFAFAHRRYQETLFVRHLVRNPSAVPPDELIMDLRWREYTVTLLQTQSTAIIEPLLKAAAAKLLDSANNDKTTRIDARLQAGVLGYYEWDSLPTTPLIALLQEGLARRLDDVPVYLAKALSRFLLARWRTGDYLDLYYILRLGGLLPSRELQHILKYSFLFGTRRMEAVAFEQSMFLQSIQPILERDIQRRLADDLLYSSNSSETLRLQALASRLPRSVGANAIIKRAATLRRYLPSLDDHGSLFGRFTSMLRPRANIGSRRRIIRFQAGLLIAVLFELGVVLLAVARDFPRLAALGLSGVAFALIGFTSWLAFLFLFRAEGGRLTLGVCLRRVISTAHSVQPLSLLLGISVVAGASALLSLIALELSLFYHHFGVDVLLAPQAPHMSAYKYGQFSALGFSFTLYPSSLFTSILTIGATMIVVPRMALWVTKRLTKSSTFQGIEVAQIMSLKTVADLAALLRSDETFLIEDVALMRSVSRLIRAMFDEEKFPKSAPPWVMARWSGALRAAGAIEDRIFSASRKSTYLEHEESRLTLNLYEVTD